VARKRWETHILTNEEKEKWIEDYVERETAVGRKPVEDTETAIQQVQDGMRNAKKAEWTTTKPGITLEEMSNAIGDSLSDLACSDTGEDEQDENDDEEDPAGGKLNEDDDPGWVMGTISTTVQFRMEHFRQQQMKLDELIQPGWGDEANYFGQRDTKYGTTELNIPAVVQPQTADDAVSSELTTFGEPLESLDCHAGQLQMPQETSRPASSHMRHGFWKPQTHKRIPSHMPALMSDWSQIHKSKCVEPVSFNACMKCPKLITI